MTNTDTGSNMDTTDTNNLYMSDLDTGPDINIDTGRDIDTTAIHNGQNVIYTGHTVDDLVNMSMKKDDNVSMGDDIIARHLGYMNCNWNDLTEKAQEALIIQLAEMCGEEEETMDEKGQTEMCEADTDQEFDVSDICH